VILLCLLKKKKKIKFRMSYVYDVDTPPSFTVPKNLYGPVCFRFKKNKKFLVFLKMNFLEIYSKIVEIILNSFGIS